FCFVLQYIRSGLSLKVGVSALRSGYHDAGGNDTCSIPDSKWSLKCSFSVVRVSCTNLEDAPFRSDIITIIRIFSRSSVRAFCRSCSRVGTRYDTFPLRIVGTPIINSFFGNRLSGYRRAGLRDSKSLAPIRWG
ncbi:hypothetical protein PMAYCL1PPCAC_30394, partial [Pristionchus mayeri]